MGSSSSNLKRDKSTPRVSYSRISFPSPEAASPRSSLQKKRQRMKSRPYLPRPTSLSSLPLNERTLLLPNDLVIPSVGRELEGSTLENDINSYSFATESPPFSLWVPPALLCAFAYALYNIFIKKGSASIHPVLGGVILQTVAAILGICLLLGIGFRDGFEVLSFDRAGIYWSVLAGVSVGAAEMISFFVMGMGVQAMQAVPIIIGGSVMFGTILGYFWLHEILTFQGWFGVFLLVTGICLVATDPGSS